MNVLVIGTNSMLGSNLSKVIFKENVKGMDKLFKQFTLTKRC